MKTKRNLVSNKNKKRLVIGLSIAGLACLAAGVGCYFASERFTTLFNEVNLKAKVLPTHNSLFTRKTSLLFFRDSDKIGTLDMPMAEIDKNSVTEVVRKTLSKRSYSSYKEPFPVKGGIVKLSEGRHPSPEKVAIGKAMGMDFDKMHVTWRNNYIKGVA